jgi:hypothetical protein
MSATVKLILELNSAEEIDASIRQVKFKPQTISTVNSLCLFHDIVTNWGIPNRIIIKNNSSIDLHLSRLLYQYQSERIRKPNLYQIKINGIDIDPDKTSRFKELKTLEGPYFDILNTFKPVLLKYNDTVEILVGFPKAHKATVQS